MRLTEADKLAAELICYLVHAMYQADREEYSICQVLELLKPVQDRFGSFSYGQCDDLMRKLCALDLMEPTFFGYIYSREVLTILGIQSKVPT